LASASLAQVTATLAEATGTLPIRPYTGVAHIGRIVPIGAPIAAHTRTALRSLTYRSKGTHLLYR